MTAHEPDGHSTRATAGAAEESFWSTLPQPVIGLSPMDGVTDAPFRRIVVRYGAPDVTLTEFTNVGDMCHGRHALSSLLYSNEERPVVAQLYGKDPALFYEAAHVVCELGFDGLDINMGCPSKNVAASGSGAGLIRTPDLAGEIIRAARQGVLDWANGQTLRGAGLKAARVELVASMNAAWSRLPARRRVIPVSVKTRLGYDSVIVERWISQLLHERPVVISLHGRTLEQMYRGSADWTAIAQAVRLARGTGTLVFGNGDVQTMQDVVTRVRDTGVHGVLIGRGTLGTPWFFRTKEPARAQAALGRRDDAPEGLEAVLDVEVPLEERFRIMIEHAREFETIFGGEWFPRMRKHLAWYCKGFPHAAALRASMVRASSSRDVEERLVRHRAHAGSPAVVSLEPPLIVAAPCA